ncbi:MAG TPA: CRISPR-associated endonuclease Cas1 [Anaeromyxobacter sp.]|nr:CRISPR-associated endonuclease Cas1 [Anaeromyxobacter sp.]
MHLGADEPVEAGQLMPVRMLNEFTYCPRLFYLEWVQGEFVDNELTVEGRVAHRRVDARAGAMPPPGEEAPFEVRSVPLSSVSLGLSARIDVVEGESGAVCPVDYKRGKPPPNELGAHEPERVQLCAYGLLLNEHGHACERGILYFAQAKTRVEVEFDDALRARTLELLAQAREIATSGIVPPPLIASPKCQGCSLHGVCLPDEVNLLAREAGEASAPAAMPVRRLVPARDDAQPLYIQEQGARVGLDGEVLEVRSREHGVIGKARLFELSQLVVLGNVQVSAQAIRELCGRGIPVCWMSFGGWLAGFTDGLGHNNVEIRRAQFRTAEDPGAALELARRFVRNKIANCRTLLRRNHPDAPEATLREMGALSEATECASAPPELLGIEGNAARLYFEAFPALIRATGGAELGFDFTTRSRRPPRDPVNALLSFAYALLAKDVAVTARAVGLDPFLGFYHQPRHGRPALALDLMEEFRPIVADSVVLSAINTGVMTGGDFVRSSLGVAMKAEGRKRFMRAYERRMEEEVTHPVFGYRISYRRILEVQCRLLARFLLGEIPSYPEFRTR